MSKEYNQDDLIRAARDNNLEEVQALVRAGADVNARNEDGETALHFAAVNGHAGVVRALCAAEGIDVNARNEYGETALHLAAEKGHVEIVRALLERDADVNAIDRKGNTALHFAAEHGHAGVFRAAVVPYIVNFLLCHKHTQDTAFQRLPRDIIKIIYGHLLESYGLNGSGFLQSQGGVDFSADNDERSRTLHEINRQAGREGSSDDIGASPMNAAGRAHQSRQSDSDSPREQDGKDEASPSYAARLATSKDKGGAGQGRG